MTKTVVAVITRPDDPVPFRGEELFRQAVDGNSVELRFGPPIEDAEILIVGRLRPETVAAAPNVRWVSFWTAGLDSRAIPDLVRRGVLVTHSSGVHAPKIAAHMMACILMFACRMPYYVRAQIEGVWKQEDLGYDDLTGKTLGIAGLGRIGEALAERARSFGMRVIATKRDVTRRYDPTIQVDALFPPEALPQMLQESDHVCITMRYTLQTHHLFNADMLSHMKPSAYLYNAARGRIIDENALIATLKDGRIRGAGLDVFDTEPLSPDSPLWEMDNVILTPHIAGYNPHYFERAAQIFGENLRRYLAGQPLNNLYDPERGY